MGLKWERGNETENRCLDKLLGEVRKYRSKFSLAGNTWCHEDLARDKRGN